MSSIPRMKMIICRHPHLLHDDAVVVIYRSKPRRRSPFSCWSEKEKRQGEVVIIIPPWKPAALLQFRCLLQNESQHHHLTSPLHFPRKVGAGGNVITFTKEMFLWKEKGEGNNTKKWKSAFVLLFLWDALYATNIISHFYSTHFRKKKVHGGETKLLLLYAAKLNLGR